MWLLQCVLIAAQSVLRERMEDAGFTVRDVPGEAKVTLTKTHNGETITVTFHIQDEVRRGFKYFKYKLYKSDAAAICAAVLSVRGQRPQ